MRIQTLFLLRALERYDLSGCPIPKYRWRQLGRETAWSVAFLSPSWLPMGTPVVGLGTGGLTAPWQWN